MFVDRQSYLNKAVVALKQSQTCIIFSFSKSKYLTILNNWQL